MAVAWGLRPALQLPAWVKWRRPAASLCAAGRNPLLLSVAQALLPRSLRRKCRGRTALLAAVGAGALSSRATRLLRSRSPDSGALLLKARRAAASPLWIRKLPKPTPTQSYRTAIAAVPGTKKAAAAMWYEPQEPQVVLTWRT